MRRPCVIALVALASACAGSRVSGQRTRLSAKDIVQRASPAIVRIEAGAEKIGTGFIVDKTGVVATNLHVIAGEAAIRVKLYDGSQYEVQQIAGVDPFRDLALLRIRPRKELPVLKLGDSDAMAAGDQVVAIGNPLGFDYSVTSGLISQVRHLPACNQADADPQQCQHDLTLLQISAAISPGSSGGPLFNQFGEVVGVTTAIVTAGQNFNLAVPGNYLKPLVAQHAEIPTDQFAQQTKPSDERARSDGGDNVRIVHKVPVHELSLFDGCKFDDIEDLVRQIGETIENGAPLYNEGKHEACFRIYEGTAVKFEHDAPCAGVRSAFGDGLLRAGGLGTYTEKAWALRDTFDGLIDVARRWVAKHPPASGKPKK